MPLKVSVGLCKKLGLPEYGSLGASCVVELEIDAHGVDDDPEAFRQRVRHAYAACRQSVESELARDIAADRNRHLQQTKRNDQQSRTRRAATQSQVRAIHAIAGRNRIELGPILHRFNVRAVADLDIRDASSVIDELKGDTGGNATGNGSG